MRPTTTKKMNN